MRSAGRCGNASCCAAIVVWLTWALASTASAHPAPFSYLDLRLTRGTVAGALVIHEYDAAFELGIDEPSTLRSPEAASRERDALVAVVSSRLSLVLDGVPVKPDWGAIEVVPDRQSLRLSFTLPNKTPGQVEINASLFPYDPAHQTFVNIYEDGALKQQEILDSKRPRALYYAGSSLGRLRVIQTFVPSGVKHILIGPDHILFLLGLLLLGGSMWRLAGIVTAFTLGHSVTLALAALDVFSPSPRIIEPLIALTIVVVGVDNLVVLRDRANSGRAGSDMRAWLAAGFGLVHGFGFASVLKELGLPSSALTWSLLAFNIGVEIGQVLIVVMALAVLALVIRRNAARADRLARIGSIAAILIGLAWFVERTFFSGGMT